MFPLRWIKTYILPVYYCTRKSVLVWTSVAEICCSILLNFIKRNGITMRWTGEKKRPLSNLFWYVRLTHQLFPSARHSRRYNESVAQTGVIKKPSTKQRTSRDCQGQPNLDPSTSPMGGLPPSPAHSRGEGEICATW